MYWTNLLEMLGGMTLAHLLAEASMHFAKKLEEFHKAKFLVGILVFIHLVSSAFSLFVGLFMYFHKKNVSNLRKSVDELKQLEKDSRDKIDALTAQKIHLQDQLRHESLRTEKRSFESGRKQGYVNGYAVGFEDCMDVLDLSLEQKQQMLNMARTSGIHRMKTRPDMFSNQKAVEVNGALR